MNAISPLPRGNITAVANMRIPLQGAQAAPFDLDFTNNASLNGDLAAIYQSGVFDFVQSVFIDNSANSATFTLTFPGLGQGRKIIAQPYSQGFYPISAPINDGRFVAATSQGQIVPITFYNVPMPYVTWGPVPGVLVVPALTNDALDLEPAAAGDNVLVDGVAGQTIKLYRTIISAGAATLLKFYDGGSVGGTLLFAAYLTAGGSLTFQASGVPWLTTSAGNNLTMNSSEAVNLYGGYGYVQD